MEKKIRKRDTKEEKYKKEQKQKREKNKIHADQKISRTRRTEMRNNLIDNHNEYKKFDTLVLMLILKDTANMEKVLLEKHKSDNGYITLSFPMISLNELEDYCKTYYSFDGFKDFDLTVFNMFLATKYGIMIDDFDSSLHDDISYNICICHGITKIDNNHGLIETNVRPYNYLTWFNDKSTTVKGFNVYYGKNALKYFQFYEKDNYLLTADTLKQILLYRGYTEKIPADEAMIGLSYCERNNCFVYPGKYDIALFLKNPANVNRLLSEKKETEELNSISKCYQLKKGKE